MQANILPTTILPWARYNIFIIQHKCLAYDIVRVCEGILSAPELVKDLVGPVPEEWPAGGWRELIGEKRAHTLPVAGHMYDKLMQKSLGRMVVESDTPFSSYISVCLDEVRLLLGKQCASSLCTARS